jgi:hypothetical protein
VIEAEQRAHDLQGGDWNREVLPFILDLRKLLIARGVLILARARKKASFPDRNGSRMVDRQRAAPDRTGNLYRTYTNPHND